MTAQLHPLNKRRTLRIRLADEEWRWLAEQKTKGTSYNSAIRRAITDKLNLKLTY